MNGSFLDIVTRSFGRILIVATLLFTASMITPSWADDDASPSPPAPFRPDEIQHGFAEFDTVPDIPDEPASDSEDATAPPAPPTRPGDTIQKPGGLFQRIVTAEGFEFTEGLRRGHLIEPVNPTTTFPSDTRVIYVVFTVFKHYAPYQVFGRVFPQQVDGLDPNTWIDEDTIYLGTEDEGGYLKFFPPDGRWIPGTYRVDIYIGYEINPINYMGTITFSVVP